jgi:hypothetical protein
LSIIWAPIAFCLWAIASSFIDANVKYVAQEKHWDRFLTQFWEPMTSWLTALKASPWFWFLFGLMLGVALVMCANKLFPDAKSKKTPIIGEQGSDSKEERQRLHSFLKALKPSIVTKNKAEILDAINDEMERLVPPKKSSSDGPPTSSP